MIQLEELYRLQQLDVEINKLEDRLVSKQILNEIERVKRKVEKLKQGINDQEIKEKKLKKEIKNEEFANSRLSKQVDNYQDELYSGEGSAKELEQLQVKISEVKAEQSELEDKILSLMMELEETQDLKINKQNELVNTKEGLANLHQKYEEEQNELELEINEVKEKKEEVIGCLTEEVIIKYNRLKEEKSGLVVVELKDKYCMGCGVGLPSRLVEQVRNNDQLTHCRNCGRILYWMQEEQQED